MTVADTNEMTTQREKTHSCDLPKQGSYFSGGDKIAEKVFGGYKAVENTVAGGYKKIEDKFVDKFLRRDGETVEEAKGRINREQEERRERQEAEAKERAVRARSVSGKLASEFDRTGAGCRGYGVIEDTAKISGAKTTAEIQANIKAKYNL